MTDLKLTERLKEIIWHIEQGETFESRSEAVRALYDAFKAAGWSPKHNEEQK